MQKKSTLASLWEQWAELVGDQLAANSRPLNLNRGVLTIGATHSQWCQAILYTRLQLLATFKAAGHQVKEIRIQQYYPQETKPQETEHEIWEKHPSRTDIHGLETCNSCKSPAPYGEIKLWGKCIFCRRQDLAVNAPNGN